MDELMSMENLFEELKKYGGGWQVIATRKFNDLEKSKVVSAEIRNSKFGLSLCMHLKSKEQVFIPLSPRSKYDVDTVVDLDKLNVIKLRKDGEDDIYRVEEDEEPSSESIGTLF